MAEVFRIEFGDDANLLMATRVVGGGGGVEKCRIGFGVVVEELWLLVTLVLVVSGAGTDKSSLFSKD